MSESKEFQILLKKIKNKQAKIGVIGLGYVGLPLAILLAKNSYSVTGFIRNEKKVHTLRSGISFLSDEEINKDLKKVINKNLQVELIGSENFSKQDVYIVCVPTPVSENKKPDISDLKSVANYLSKVALFGKLIMNESTVAPFMTRDVLGNLGGLYFLVCSPERIDPGNEDKNTENIPKVVGGINSESVKLAQTLYEKILKEKVVQVESMEAAEMAKMLENTYRAVNIALVNEFARLAEVCDIDILDVIKAAKTKWSFHAHYPGVGVGGHCIPVDPYYILELAKSRGISMDVVKTGLKENENMPEHLLKKVLKYYVKGMTVIVYGITYKKNVNDLRESPVIHFCSLLKKTKIPFTVYDPTISDEDIKSLGFIPGNLAKKDIFIVGTDHFDLIRDYKKIVGKDTIIFDGRNYFLTKKGKKVIGIGRTLL